MLLQFLWIIPLKTEKNIVAFENNINTSRMLNLNWMTSLCFCCTLEWGGKRMWLYHLRLCVQHYFHPKCNSFLVILVSVSPYWKTVWNGSWSCNLQLYSTLATQSFSPLANHRMVHMVGCFHHACQMLGCQVAVLPAIAWS